MSGRYARLKKEWLLRGWTDVSCAAVNWVNGSQRILGKKRAYVAESCDGDTDFDSLLFLPVHQSLLDELIDQGIVETCEKGDLIDPCQQYRQAPNLRLTGLHWAVTGKCNLNCRHCYMASPSGRYGELPSEDMMRLIEEFDRANVCEVSLTGGEPLLRNDLLDIVEALTARRIRVSVIYSNGLLITEEILARIKGTGINPYFQISFDGIGGHDYMRGTDGVEAATIGAIRKVRAAGFGVVVATSIDDMNKGCLKDTYDLLKGLDIQYWRMAPPHRTGNWRGTTTEVALENEMDVYLSLLKRWVEDEKPFHLELGDFFRDPDLIVSPEGTASKAPYRPDSFDCRACRENPYLLPDGTLLPCPGYTDTALQKKMPNILRQGLSEAWNRSFLRSLADMKKMDLLARNPECATCDLFQDCGMGCRASAVMETEDLMALDPRSCEMWKNGYKQRFEERAGLVK